MNIVVGDVSSPPAPTFLTQGFRPFCLAAGLWSAASLALWIVMFATGSAVPSRFDPLAWHIHEMLFGFVMNSRGECRVISAYSSSGESKREVAR
jgi:uncharacterized protein involved in response to NO